MSGTSSPNTWTIVSPEETETLRPLTEETEQREKHSTAVEGLKTGEDPAEASPALEPPVLGEKNQELVKDDLTSVSDVINAPILDVASISSPNQDAHCQSEGAAGESSLTTDSFSDSWSHITTTPDEPSGSLMTPETLVGSEFTQQDDATSHPGNDQEGPADEEGADLTSLSKPAECTEATADEPEVRRRRSLLAALERVGRTEEEEEVEEDFQLPHREEEESWFSLNKCILGAVLLVGLGTIFFSGVLMEIHEESDYVTRELKDDARGKQEWTDPVTPPPNVDASELHDKLAGEDEQISLPQAQHKDDELKVSQALAAEGAAEHQEEESSGLKKAMETLSLLQEENERMRRELESVPGLQEEVNTLRSAVTELKRPTAPHSSSTSATSPSSSQQENSHKDTPSDERKAEKVKDGRKEKHDEGEKKQWKEREKSECEEAKRDRKNKERKNEKFDKGIENKQKMHKEWKQKEERGDDGKPWKDRENEWHERRDGKDKREWRKHENSHQKSKDMEDENRRERNDYKVRKEWNNEGIKKMDHGKERKDQRERKEWRRDGEERSQKDDHDRRQRKEGKGKDKRKERGDGDGYGKGRDERKQWNEGERSGKGRDEKKQWDTREHFGEERKQWKEDEWKSRKGDKEKDTRKKNERNEWNDSKGPWRGNEKKLWRDEGVRHGEDHDPAMERTNEQWERKEESWSKERKKQDGEWKKDRTSFHTKEEHLWGDRKSTHSHRRLTLDQPEYWTHQRGRLQGNPRPRDLCSSLEACAQAEGLLPVPLAQFQSVLQTYLSKAEQFGVESAKRDELLKLASEFFKDGLFVHDQMRFQDFADDVSDILEDMVEGEEEEEDDSALEDEMEDFGKEVVRKFLVEKVKGERKKESRRARG